MRHDKFIIQSKTIWGVIIMAAPTVLTTLGMPMPDGLSDELNAAVLHLIEAFGGALAIYGRIVADKQVRLKP